MIMIDKRRIFVYYEANEEQKRSFIQMAKVNICKYLLQNMKNISHFGNRYQPEVIQVR